jgi:putative ABC transport system permease protein
VTTDIGWEGVAISLVLIVVAIALSWRQGLALERSIAWASLRAGVQLGVVGIVLAVVLDPDTPEALAWLWVAAMVCIAALTVRARAAEVPGIGALAFVAVAAVTASSMAVIFGLGMFPTEPAAIVPLAGMVIGNSLAQTAVAARRVVAELHDHRDELEARLSLGMPWQEAARPRVAEALRTALQSQIETTKVVGLVALPGSMTGLILAGVDAGDAVQVQLAVMYVILGSVAISVSVVGVGLARLLFTPDHRLRPLPMPAR